MKRAILTLMAIIGVICGVVGHYETTMVREDTMNYYVHYGYSDNLGGDVWAAKTGIDEYAWISVYTSMYDYRDISIEDLEDL